MYHAQLENISRRWRNLHACCAIPLPLMGQTAETSPPPRPTLHFKGKSRLEIVWNDLFDDSISGTTFTIEWGRDEIFRHSDGQITSENASISIATESQW